MFINTDFLKNDEIQLILEKTVDGNVEKGWVPAYHFAGKACLLLFELARKHDMQYLIITCNPDNHASRKTCEYAGGELLEIAELPKDNDMRDKGETEKCIFRFRL